MFELNNYNMHDQNTYKVLRFIILHGPLTKRQIQNYTGLSWGGVCNSTAKLMQWGLIEQRKQQEKVTSGRIPNKLDIKTTDNLCIGVDVTLGRINGILSSLNGKCLYSRNRIMQSNLSSVTVDALMEMLEDLFTHVDDSSKVKAIGLALPGSIVENWGRGKLEHPFHGVFPVNLKEMVQQRFGVMTEIFHDPDCLLVAELNAMPPEEIDDNIMVLRWSHGMGLSMMIHHKLYHGSSGTAGEIGHTVIDPSGNLCSCGKRGCLETYASVHVLLNSYKRAIDTGQCKLINSDIITFDDLIEAYQQNDPYVESLMTDAMNRTSMVLANTINIIDPKLVIVSGEFSRISKDKFDVFHSMTMQHVLKGSRAEICQSILDDNAAALGAALLMRDQIYSELFDSRL